jgi:hypothetical protein
MKPEKKLLIWLEPAAAVELCKIVEASICPANVEFSDVMIVNGDALLKVFREMRDPVTTTDSVARAAGTAGQSAVAAVPGAVGHGGFAAGDVWADAEVGKNARALRAVAQKSAVRIDGFTVNPQVAIAGF